MAKVVLVNGQGSSKAINPFDTDNHESAWTPLGVQQKALSETDMRLVTTVFAALDARYKAAADIPFVILDKNGKEVDSSDDYKNVIGIMPNPAATFGLAEFSLAATGCAYFFAAKNKFKYTKELRYWLSDTVTAKFTEAGDLDGFARKVNGREVPYSKSDVLYVWLVDDQVEVGPPVKWPLASALVSAGALQYINLFIRDFMQRGAVKAMILALDGDPPPDEVKRIEKWFNTFMRGVRNVVWRAFNMSAVKPTIIGEGLEAFKNLEIKNELKADILEALGVPASLLAVGWATREGNARKEDGRWFYDNTVMPDMKLWQFAFNEQVLAPMGYKLRFEPKRLEVFQIDEAEKVNTFSNLLGALEKNVTPDKMRVAIEVSGLAVTEEQIEALIKKDTPPEPPDTGGGLGAGPGAKDDEDIAPMDDEAQKEIGRWQRHAIRVGGPKSSADFQVQYIGAPIAEQIRAGLIDAVTNEEIKAVFADVRRPAHRADDRLEGLRYAMMKLADVIAEQNVK